MTTADDVRVVAQAAIDEAVATVAGQLVLADETIAALTTAVEERNAAIADLEAALAACQAAGAARFPGDPGIGNLFIGESRQGGDPTDRETYCGHTVGIFRSYVTAGTIATANATIATAARDKSKGRYPLCSTKVPGTWAQVADGVNDAWLFFLLDGLGALDWPVGLCLHHEPFDNQGPGNTPASYRAMHKRAKDYVDAKPGNKIAITPILQSSPFSPSVGGNADVTAWFAADSCHCIGLDGYNHKSFNPANGNQWRDPAVVFEVVPVVIEAFGKPVVVAETGVRTDPNQPGRAATWMHRAVSLLKATDLVYAVSFFDSGTNVNDGGSSWQFDADGPERLDAFKDLILTQSAFL